MRAQLLIVFIASLNQVAFGESNKRYPSHTPWASSYEMAFLSQVNESTVALLEERIVLSAEQKSAIRAMWESHKDQFSRFVAANRPMKLELDRKACQFETTNAAWILAEFEREEKLARVADQQAQLDQTLFEQVKGILNDGQLAQWADFETEYNRKRWVHCREQYLEEPLDQIEYLEYVCEELDIAMPAETHDLARVYAIELDEKLRALVNFEIAQARKEYRKDKERWIIEGDKTWNAGDSVNPTEFRATMKKRKDSHRRIADVNKRWQPVIAASLPEDARHLFNWLYYRAAMKPAGVSFIDMPATEFVGNALEIVDLTDNQKELLSAVQQEHESKVLERAQQVIQAYDKKSDSMRGPINDDEKAKLEEHLIRAAEQLREFERSVIRQVWEVLTEDQRANVEMPYVP